MRAFIAIDLPNEFISQTADVARQLKSCINARYIPRENYHVTLVFLGDLSAHRVDAAIECMQCLGDREISLVPDGIGKFGKSQNATLWLGLQKTHGLMESAKKVRTNLETAGIEFDGKSFLPHITIARHADIPAIDLPPLVFPQRALAPSMTLYKSMLSKDGAVYKPIFTVDFA